LITASLFEPIKILHPLWMSAFLLMTAVSFSLFGFILGLWAKGWEQLQFIPMLVVTPLTFLGGAFYSIGMLPPHLQPVQSHRLSHQRFPLELLRHCGRERRAQLERGVGLPGDLPRGSRLDIQDGISAEELAPRLRRPDAFSVAPPSPRRALPYPGSDCRNASARN
jgi:hypothetical protein